MQIRGDLPGEAARRAPVVLFYRGPMASNVLRRKINTTVYITPEQDEQLKLLASRTGVPVAEYVREGIGLMFAKHAALIDQMPAEPVRPASARRRAPSMPPAPDPQPSLFDAPTTRARRR